MGLFPITSANDALGVSGAMKAALGLRADFLEADFLGADFLAAFFGADFLAAFFAAFFAVFAIMIKI
jgi:hypothetical protein